MIGITCLLVFWCSATIVRPVLTRIIGFDLFLTTAPPTPAHVQTVVSAEKVKTLDHVIRARILELVSHFGPGHAECYQASKVERQSCAYAIDMLCFRATVVLAHVVEIQNDLALGQQHSSKGTTPQ